MCISFHSTFYRCIRGHLKDKVVILVTHQLHFLKKVDKIIVLHQGEIAEMGSFNELMSNTKGRLHMLLEERRTQSQHGSTQQEISEDSSSTISIKSEIYERKLSKSNQNIVLDPENAYWDSNR